MKRIKAFLEVFRQSKKPIRLIFGQIIVKTGLHKFINIQLNGYKIRFSKSNLAQALFVNPHDRDDDEGFLKRVLKPEDTYVDVGANIGTLALTAAILVTPKGSVTAVEAHPNTFKVLEENISLNKSSNIKLINCAVGNKAGTIFFSNINTDDQNKVLLKNAMGIEVPLNTLDNLLYDLKEISLLKIDVEGYEKFVLEGAEQTLSKTSVVYFESWEHHFKEFDYSTKDVIKIFVSNGFEVYELHEENKLKIVSTVHTSNYCQNLLALKDVSVFSSKNNFHVIA